MKSMTGYGKSILCDELYEISCDIRSVNSRYLETQIKYPKFYGFFDDKIRKLISSYITRGKVEVYFNVKELTDKSYNVNIRKPLLEQYVEKLREIGNEYSLCDDLSLSWVTKLNDVVDFEKTEPDTDSFEKLLLKSCEASLEIFNTMRKTEGEKLKEDLLTSLETVKSALTKIKSQSPSAAEKYKLRLYETLKETLQDKNIDEQRILQEAAIYADKVCVDEETVRLDSHISQFTQTAKSSEAVGKKLDFIVQEMNRESNTIGSKCANTAITNEVFILKSEIEKIREQIQNIE